MLAKELNDKSTVLAGVKDKTKAYVEKLKKDKAAAVAALEEQVGIRVRATHVVGVNRDAFRLKNRKHTMRLSRAGEKKTTVYKCDMPAATAVLSLGSSGGYPLEGGFVFWLPLSAALFQWCGVARQDTLARSEPRP